MDEDQSPPDSDSRPTFSSFWKRTKEASASATRQVTFVPIDIPRIAKGRTTKKQTKTSSNDQNVSRSRDRTYLGGSGGDQGEEGGMEGPEGGEAAHSFGESGESGDLGEPSGGPGASNRTAKEKAQIRRAQVRRAQIQHRRRKADYMRQLELDIDMLRDLITTTEQDMKNIQKDNDAIRMQLGIATLVRNGQSSSVNVGAGAVGFGGRARAMSRGDAAMSDVPVVSVTPAPARTPAAGDITNTNTNAIDSIASSLSPLSISPNNTANDTSPSGTAHTTTSYDSMDSPSSIFTGIELDDINVSIVIDEAIGNPVYQISSITPDMCFSTFPDDFNAMLTQGLPVSPFEHGFVPTFETELANSTQPPAGREVAHSATAYFLPDLTVAETHSIVNFILALEHVCWGHAGHQFHDPESTMRAEHGHAMMATSLFLREAPEGVFDKIETSTKGMSAFMTNTTPEDSEATRIYVDTHQASDGLQWQAPDVTLQTLYGLAVSLNPISEKELAPVQAWFELASRYPLFLLLRTDIVEALKRELVGVVRCLYFGAVMEREAFESVVQRVVEPAMQAIEAAQSVAPQSNHMQTGVADFA